MSRTRGGAARRRHRETLARWARDGLVPHARDGRWTPAAVAQARIVARLRERGHSLDEIRAATESGRLAFGFVEELLPAHERDLHARGGRRRDRPRARADRAHVPRRWASTGRDRADLRRRPRAAAPRRRRAGRRLPARRVPAARARLRPGARADGRRRGAPLPPLRARAAHARRRPGLARWPRRWRSSRASCCRWPRRSWTTCTSASCTHFVEQDVIGHMEADLEDAPLDLGRLRVADRLRRPRRLHAPDRGGGRGGGASTRSSASSRTSRYTLPDDARVIKTIGDEVMIVGSDAAALVDWAVGFQRWSPRRPLPRIGMHYGETLYRDGDYYGREVNLAARVAARAAGGEVLVTRPVVDLAGRHLEFERIGEVRLKGFADADRAVRRPAPTSDDPRVTRGCSARVRAPGCSAAPGRARRRAALRRARLGLPARRRRRARWLGGARAARQLRAARGGRRRRGALPRAVRAARGRARRAPAARGRRTPATCRRGRATCATRRQRGWRAATAWPSGTPPPTRPRPCSTGWPRRPGAARCSGCRRATGASCARCWRVTREETGAWCRARGLAWRDDATNASDAFARGRVRHGLLPALRAIHPAAEANVVRTAELLREEAEVLDVVVDTALAGRDEIALAHLAALPPALARLVVRRLAEAATGGPVPRAAAAWTEILALGAGRDGALDVGDGARARRRGRDPALRADPGAAATAPTDSRRCATPPIGEILVQPDELQHRVRELGARDHARLRGPRPAARRRAQGRRVLPRPTSCATSRPRARSTSWRWPPTARRPTPAASCASSRTSTPRSRAAHVLIVEDIVDSGLTLQYLLRNLGARDPASLEVCALLTKPERRKVDLPIALRRLRDPEPLRHRLRPRPSPSATATCRTSRRSRRPTGPTPDGGAPSRPDRRICAVLLVGLPPCPSHRSRRRTRHGPDMSRFFKSAAFPILIVVVLAFFAQRLINTGTEEKPPTYSEFISQLERGEVKSVELKTKDNTVVVTPREGKVYETGYTDDGATGSTPSCRRRCRRTSCRRDYNIEGRKTNGWLWLLTYVLPFLIFIGFWIFLMNQVQGGGSKVMSFGKSRAKRMSVDSPKITFRDVAGVDEAVEELHEIKEFLENPKKFQALGARIPKGVLLFGPPGHRQDPARPRGRRRGGRAVLLDLRLGLRRDVRRRRRQPRARPLRAGQAELALHHLHGRDRRRRPPPRRRPRRRSRRARADAQPAPRRDGRLRR